METLNAGKVARRKPSLVYRETSEMPIAHAYSSGNLGDAWLTRGMPQGFHARY